MKVLVLAGGPDAERKVSLKSATAVTEALQRSGRYDAKMQTIDTPSLEQLRRMEGDIVFPALHGKWGEGGPMQDLLVALGRPFVGCGPGAARLAMDKVATKMIAASIGVATTATFVLEPRDAVCPLPFPVVVKPIHEGSTIGLFMCGNEEQWRRAHAEAAKSGRPTMIEPYIPGREVTVGMIDGTCLPLIEITPAEGLYDYEAKYNRDDTRYTMNPHLPGPCAQRMMNDSMRLWSAMGMRHLCRVDWIVDGAGTPWLLEVNTMPGFTDHSLVPMAAAAIPGVNMQMPALCAALVDLAVRDSAAGMHTQMAQPHQRRQAAAAHA